MEENEDIIYDLAALDENAQNANNDENVDNDENANNDDNAENNKNDDNDENDENDENSENPDPARTEIDRMVEDMGADTLLQIIRDNRNAAIRQIISEMQDTSDEPFPSGLPASLSCTSIFDLAAQA